jgi:hypothetical protein
MSDEVVNSAHKPAVCTESLNPDILVMKSAKVGV